MARIHYLNVPTKTYMAAAREELLACFSLVRQGREKAALRSANRAIEAYDKAMGKSQEPGHRFLFKPIIEASRGDVHNVA